MNRTCAEEQSPVDRLQALQSCYERLMAKRRTYKRDRRGRFASTGGSRVRRVGRKINRRRPRYVRGSLGNTVRVGPVGPGGEYAGVHVGAKLRTKRRSQYYVGVSAGRRIATPYAGF